MVTPLPILPFTTYSTICSNSLFFSFFLGWVEIYGESGWLDVIY